MTEMTGIREINDIQELNVVSVLKDINISGFLDKWGPSHVLMVYDSSTNMQGILVMDNLVLGPGCGRIIFSKQITPYEVFQYARTMTWSCALADVKLGGAAAGIRANPLDVDRIQNIKSFAREISPYVPDQFIAAPHRYSGKEEMAAFIEEIGDRRGAIGKPKRMGGIPFEVGVIGFGIGVAIEEIVNLTEIQSPFFSKMADTRIAIQGFDSIGATLATYLSKKGGRIVGVSDEWCCLHDPDGLNIDEIRKWSSGTSKNNSLCKCNGIKKLPSDDFIKIDCDIFVFTTCNNYITKENVNALNAKCVVEGINKPMSPGVERLLQKKNIVIIPNILTLASCAITAYAEYKGKPPEIAFSMIEATIQRITRYGFKHFSESGISLRRILTEKAKKRILNAREATYGQ